MPSVKLAGLFKREPVFNQQVDLNSRHHTARVLYAAFLASLLGVSVAVIALKALTIKFIFENRNTGFMFETNGPEPVVLAALPRMLYFAPAKIAIVAAAVSIMVVIGHGIFVVKDWHEGAKTQCYSFRRNSMYLHLTNSILVLFSLVSIYVTHKSTSHFFPGYVDFKAKKPGDNGVRYNIGTFDLETWSCELKTADGAQMVWQDYGMQCEIEYAGRMVMIPFMVLAFTLAGLTIWGLVGGKRDPDGERMKTEDVGLEMGKFNAI
ncbi:hypothetical protein BDV96DRAFT_489251 [Lophiotrema nucula]|uniref:Uncharacterized protein n=1 Tax=Lophiotrema nucula TaxID=690887 RepID=A0A6A5ZHY1_9PLEO|nr:hypothetical protein BDV96DRAFT_489251 [Lophiotrema nucula]